MTVSYSLQVSNARLGGFVALLFRWRGSIYRLMYREMVIYLILFYSLAILYRYALSDDSKHQFEQVAMYCKHFTDLVPVTFVLGFYVTLIVGRWWQVFMNLPFPDRCAYKVSAYVRGSDERARLIRRAIVRYMNLMAALTFQNVSMATKKRFPTIDHFVDGGLMTKNEKEKLEQNTSPYGNYFIPCSWATQLVYEARKEGRISSDTYCNNLIEELLNLRRDCGTVFGYDWISVPLVYTQVVTISVYSYFLATLFGHQYLEFKGEASEKFALNTNILGKYVPVYTIFQFFFYMGWLKVAEELMNPLGEDDDDFEVNYILDRNVQVAYLLVDPLHAQFPAPEKDKFWNEPEPEIPYTAASEGLKAEGQGHLGSVAAVNVAQNGSLVVGASAALQTSVQDVAGTTEDAERGALARSISSTVAGGSGIIGAKSPPLTRPKNILVRLLSRQSSTKSISAPAPPLSRPTSTTPHSRQISQESNIVRGHFSSPPVPHMSPLNADDIVDYLSTSALTNVASGAALSASLSAAVLQTLEEETDSEAETPTDEVEEEQRTIRGRSAGMEKHAPIAKIDSARDEHDDDGAGETSEETPLVPTFVIGGGARSGGVEQSPKKA